MYDCYGNYIEFKYENDGRESRIDEILYTGNSVSGLTPYNKIKFHYSERQDINTIYLGGSALSGNNTKVDKVTFTNKYLLNVIEITAEDKHFKTYELKYGYDGVQSYLAKVTEYGSDGSPLNPTIFKYGEHDYKLGSLVQSNALYGNVADIIPGDFNGDGVSDVFVANYFIQDNIKFHTDLEVYINGSSGLNNSLPIENGLSDYQVFTPINTKRNTAFFNSDYNGDGQDDILLTKLFTSVINGYSSLESIRIYHSEPNATAFTPTEYCNSSTYKYVAPGDNFLLPGDFDGDGRKDFITIGRNSSGTTVKTNLTFPATYSTCSDQITDVAPSAHKWAEANDLNVIDFNGDGKDDVFVNYGGQISIYTYDVSGGVFVNVWNTTYKDNGNIDTKTDAGTYTYHATKIHAIETVTNPSNVIGATQQDMLTYTSFQQPEKITEGDYELTFTYSSHFNRQKTELKQNGSTINTRYFLGNYEKDVKNGTTRHIHYVTCGDGLNAIVVRQNGSDTYYYTYTDHLGSITTATDASGNIVAEQNFDAWGRRRNPADWTYNNIPTTPDWLYRGYTGHEELPEFDLINMNGRVYDPVLGRMLSPDNFVPDASSSQGYNRYTYAFNNPLKYTDPNGENPLIVLGIAALAGGTLNVAYKWNEFSGFAEGFQYFTAGATAGAIATVNPKLGFLAAFGFNSAIDAGKGLLDDLSPVQTALHHGGNLLNATGAGAAATLGKSGFNLLQKWGWTNYNKYVALSAKDIALTSVYAGGTPSVAYTVETVAAKVTSQEVTKATAVTAANVAKGSNVIIGNGGKHVSKMAIVREVRHGEKISDLIPFLQNRTFTTGVEHAIVRLGSNSVAPGARVIVSGGRHGISFAPNQISTLWGHTHPYVTGASAGDIQALQILKQTKQYIFEGFNTNPLIVRPY